MQKGLIIFDYDGTLFLETDKINYESLNATLLKFNMPPVSKQATLEMIGDTVDSICRQVLGPDNLQVLPHFVEELTGKVLEVIDEKASLDKEVIAMLKTLKSKNMIIYICSNGSKEYLTANLAKFDLGQYISFVWHSHPGISKTDAVGILIKMAHNPNIAIMVGDRREDIEAGKQNGCITIGMRSYFGDNEIQDADFIVNDHCEMTMSILEAIRIFKNSSN